MLGHFRFNYFFFPKAQMAFGLILLEATEQGGLLRNNVVLGKPILQD